MHAPSPIFQAILAGKEYKEEIPDLLGNCRFTIRP